MTLPQLDEETLIAHLTDAWQEVLLLGVTDPDADFLELNGMSITAVRLAVRIRKATGVAVTVEAIYDFSTPRSLAAALVAGTAPLALD